MAGAGRLCVPMPALALVLLSVGGADRCLAGRIGADTSPRLARRRVAAELPTVSDELDSACGALGVEPGHARTTVHFGLPSW